MSAMLDWRDLAVGERVRVVDPIVGGEFGTIVKIERLAARDSAWVYVANGGPTDEMILLIDGIEPGIERIVESRDYSSVRGAGPVNDDWDDEDVISAQDDLERRSFNQAEFDAFCADPKRRALVERILKSVGMEPGVDATDEQQEQAERLLRDSE